MSNLVSVHILNYKQAGYIPSCMDALMQQTYPNLEIFFTDNASGDGSVELVSSRYSHVHVIANQQNLYFSRAHNLAIQESHGDYIMPLNVDIVLAPDYIAQMVHAIELDPLVGMVSGKLLQMDSDLTPLTPATIDSTGLWFSTQLRHFDRGSLEIDRGQYNQIEYIFGPSGAAPLYQREMLEDIAYEAEYFDDDFVIYREDADLAWRAQLLGWKGIYTPKAIAYHVRRVRPTDERKTIAPDLNMHSVKNRFLMRVKNQTRGNAIRCLFPAFWRDVQVLGYVLLFERSSIKAFKILAQLFPRTLKKRNYIMKKKCVEDAYINQWFSKRPVSFPYKPMGSPR